MPIWLRKFTYQQIADQKQREQKEIDKSIGKSNTTSAKIGDSQIPQHMKEALTKGPRKPSYKTKASKK